MGGCLSTPFVPTLSETPTTTQADAPLGLTVDLHVPSGDTNLQSAVVTLPAGRVAQPVGRRGAAGLHAHAARHRHEQPGPCPGAAPQLARWRSIRRCCPPRSRATCTSARRRTATDSTPTASSSTPRTRPTGSRCASTGSIVADPSTGQLTATFANTPPIPFTDLKLNFNGGPQAPLASPGHVRRRDHHEHADADERYSAASTSVSYTVDANGSGGTCPTTPAFAPTMSLTTPNTNAGAGDPITINFASGDQQQNLGSIAATLPPGLIGEIKGVPLCASSQASAGTCSSDSQIGTATVSAGVGSSPLQLSPGTCTSPSAPTPPSLRPVDRRSG